MGAAFSHRILIHSLGHYLAREVLLRGWVYRLRVLARTTFIILRDCSGEVQSSENRSSTSLKSPLTWPLQYYSTHRS
jgi:nondiscriminating aspartyl-tRNA synthetase